MRAAIPAWRTTLNVSAKTHPCIVEAIVAGCVPHTKTFHRDAKGHSVLVDILSTLPAIGAGFVVGALFALVIGLVREEFR